MAVESVEPDRRLVAEGHRQRVLQVGAPGHRRVAVFARELGEMAAHRRQILLDQGEPGADLQHRGGVHDVLGRGAPMQIAPRLARQFGHLADERQDRIADGLGLVLQARQVERLAAAGQRIRRVRDRVGCLGRDDPEPSLGARESRLDLDAAREKGVVAEHLAHRRGAEHVGKDRGVESADRHRG